MSQFLDSACRNDRGPALGRSRLAAGVVCGALALAGCSGTGDGEAGRTPAPAPSSPAGTPDGIDPELAGYYGQELAWAGCGGDAECATVEVPLDYAAPAGERVELSVLKVRATGDPEERIGSLLVNPGGPGVSGVDYARAARAAVSESARQRYDVVGFDPRGVARSAPVDCVDDAQLDEILAGDPTPDDVAEVAGLQRRAGVLAQGCADRSGQLLPHVGTVAAARDLDVLRAVLGDERLSYLGKSYGTFLGAAYARLFPERIAAMVLDGVLSPTVTGREMALGQAEGFEAAFDAFVTDCVAGQDCPLGPTVAEARATFQQLLGLIDRVPLPTDQPGRPLTEGLALYGVALPLYFAPEEGWPVLRDALTQALAGDGSALLALADRYLLRDDGGSYSGNLNEALSAVNCLDRPRAGSVAEVEASVPDFVAAAPTFGAALAWSGVTCAVWPIAAEPDTTPVQATGAPPILVVGTTGDPATPYAWAQALAASLDDGRLLTYEGFVHTAYLAGSDCVDEAVDSYLLDATLPAEGTVCG